MCVENTHLPAGGRPYTLDELKAVSHAAGPLPIHMDGARLFNAEVATGIKAADYAAQVTTVMSCLSKGLAAPVGSLLAGPADVIAQARVERQRLGGGMRQAGVIAAAGLIALNDMVDRLADDHARARRLADAVAERWPGACDPASGAHQHRQLHPRQHRRAAGPPRRRTACAPARSRPVSPASSPTATSTTTTSPARSPRFSRRPVGAGS